jgi:hypothetical protein
VVALFVSLRIIRLRQMAAICRQAFGEFLLIIAHMGGRRPGADRAVAWNLECNARPRYRL